jgi:hypothetical protein
MMMRVLFCRTANEEVMKSSIDHYLREGCRKLGMEFEDIDDEWIEEVDDDRTPSYKRRAWYLAMKCFQLPRVEDVNIEHVIYLQKKYHGDFQAAVSVNILADQWGCTKDNDINENDKDGSADDISSASRAFKNLRIDGSLWM